MGFLATLQSDIGKRYPKPINPQNGPQPPGRFSFGTQLYGGPRYTDAFNSQPGPSLTRLVENYSALIYAMVARNRNAVARVPMRLLADGSRAQGRPGRACDAIKLSRSVGRALAKEGKVSSASVDQVFEIRNHPLLDVLDEPDPYGTFTREKLIGLMVSYMDVVGSAYLVPEGNGWDWTNPTPRIKGPPQNLWVIYPQWTIPVRMGASPIVSTFQYFSDRLPYQSVIWFRHNHSLRDAYGASFSPTYAGEPYRKQEQELVSILSQVLGIGPRPNLIATAKDPLSGVGKHEADAFKVDLAREHSGGNAGGILVNTGAWDFTPVDYPKADIAAKEISEHDRNNLAAIFDQPPTFYTVDTNVANLTAAKAMHNEQGVEPRCKTIAAQFTRLARMCDPRLFFAHDPVAGENALEQAQVDKIYVDMGAITLNELNEEKKYSPKSWGDEPWLPGTLVQPSMAIEKHELGLEQGKKAMESQGTKDEIAEGQHEIAQGSHELAKDSQQHTQEMDKAKLALESKAAKEERMMDLAESVLRSIQAELGSMAR